MIRVKFGRTNLSIEQKTEPICIEINHFPDGTQRLNLEVPEDAKEAEIRWKYSCDEEMVTLFYIVSHLRNNNKNIALKLVLGYVPNARMDRVKNPSEVFTLKYFCEFINSLSFDEVVVMDPHSYVTPALLNNVNVISANNTLSCLYLSVSDECCEKPCVFYPDSGAMKRYSDAIDCEVFYGEKVRVWETGEIKGLEVRSKKDNSAVERLGGKDFLIIDDIISYGGTMYHSVKKLKELDAGKIYIYCTHLENSSLDEERGLIKKLIDEGLVERVYTTNTLFTGENEKIKIIKS